MGQITSALYPSNEMGLVCSKEILTNHSGLLVLKLQPGGDLLFAGNEVGTLLIYDISANSDSPRQVISLSFEYGGISEICWMDANSVAIGTTRGRIIIFSMKNELKRLVEISSAKAHGDRAAQIAVEGLDYCPESHILVSVAEGVGSVRLGDISDEGIISAKVLPKLTTAYCTPRYVGFCHGGSQLIVGFMERSLIQIFSTDPLEIKAEFRLGQESGIAHLDRLGNALVLDSMDRLVVYDLHHGCAFYNLPGMVRTMDAPYASNRDDGNPYCNQGIAPLGNAAYVASVSKHGAIQILRTRDGSRAGLLKIPGRRHRNVQAIHAASGNRTVLIAASTDGVNNASQLTIWRNKEDRLLNGLTINRHEQSTVRIALLCIAICLTFQMGASLLPVGDIRTLFRDPSSTFEVQPHYDGGLHSTSQPLITLAMVAKVTPATDAYDPLSTQPSSKSQLPTLLHQSINADSVGSNHMSLSAGLCGDKQVIYDSTDHNSEGLYTTSEK